MLLIESLFPDFPVAFGQLDAIRPKQGICFLRGIGVVVLILGNESTKGLPAVRLPGNADGGFSTIAYHYLQSETIGGGST